MMSANEDQSSQQQHNENDPPRPSVDFGWNIFGAEFDPENPHTGIEEPKPEEPINAVLIQDASVVTHVEGEIVKLTPDKHNTKPSSSTNNQQQAQQQMLPPQTHGRNSTTNRNSSNKQPMPPTEPAGPPEQTACCAGPDCVIS